MDLWLEGITRSDKDRLEREWLEVLPLKDRKAMTGASKGGCHYLGTAERIRSGN